MRRIRPYLIYAALALLLTFPLLSPGYVFALDMVFVPHLPMPSTLSSNYLFLAGLHVLNSAIPSEVLEKAIILAIFVGAGVGAHRLCLALRPASAPAWRWGCYFAGVVYMVNPFVYSRFMAGQYLVLLGYVLLPFFLRAFWRCVHEPGWQRALVAAGWLVAISIVSVHTVGLAMLVAAGFVALRVWWRQHGQRTLAYAGMVLAVTLVACSYWLVPALLGHGKIVGTIAGFGSADLTAFATSPTGFGLFGNVLSMQGFWADGKSLYLLPSDLFSWWWLPWLGLWALALFGIYKSWRAGRGLTLVIAGAAVAAAALAVGTAGTFVAPLNDWLVHYIPFFAGYREPQKFVALIALAYAYFGACGVAGLASYAQRKFRKPWAASFSLPAFALPALCAPLMFGGFYGQIVPAYYPADWFAIDNYLQTTADGAKTLFLPWHLYMSFGFAGRVIANPAPKFFANPMVISSDPEMSGAKSYASTADQQQLQTVILPLASSGDRDFAKRLVMLKIRYVLLAKELDYKEYAFLDSEDGIRLAKETQTLKLYTVTSP